MKLSWILSLGFLACVVTQTPANAQNICGPRVRRNWESLSGSEKDTYKRAIAAAMDSGAYIKFVEMHMETMSNMEAHKQCMFIYWHRYFLIAFENMLRGQGHEFACVTIPYFNWMVAQSRQMNGECTSFGDCAAIATELGGFTSGSTQQGVINSDAINGNVCVNNMPLNHFCGSSAPGTACAGCLPRGNWGSISLPAAAGYGSVRGQVFEGQNINQTSTKIETGAHGSVHSSLGSTMGTLASPADPIFWSHHSMVDALHTIFHKCRVGTQRMSFEEKASNPVAWSSCNRRDNDGDQFNEGSVFNPTDIVTMRTGPKNANPVNGSEDPIIGKFIRGVPNRFADLVDVRDLGDYSYSYELSGQLASMYTELALSTTASNSNGAPISLPIDTQQMADARRFFGWLWNTLFPNNQRSFSRLVSKDGMVDTGPNAINQQNDTATIAPSKINPTYDDGKVDVIILNECSEAEQRVMTWYKQTTATMGGQTAETMADLERQSCMFHEQCLGGVTGFSEEFKATWGFKGDRCKIIVDAVQCGDQQIIYTQWRENMEAYFGCPAPANTTTPAPTNQNQTSSSNQTSPTDQAQQVVGDNMGNTIAGAINDIVQSV
ncbi:hypothetical protein BBJ29_008867 [Phytophthora kernoviae]|uniref:Tyrosinase copper-binding domain-containing protein n=1 Tax=Phytophthora kernoviae TaxID=325452 RepID=A0A3F2RCF2_9STRA|nr:hypothetical protein BBP00_00009504 [Phytophthora kernoviae]RLN70343.1 hypothetical protein BBJ29_008867 [Phytophthora kernoviae]